MATELLSLFCGQIGWLSQRGDGCEVNAALDDVGGWYQGQDIQTEE